MKTDRRQTKTRAAILNALSALLRKKHFQRITVQEIIDEANVGRSTFYSHFETKDELLKAMCSDIFDHIISEELSKEKTHDYSKGERNIRELLEHILFHLQDDKEEIKELLASESEGLFLDYFKESLKELFSRYTPEKTDSSPAVPDSFRIDFLSAGFVEAVRWWVANRMEYTPGEVSAFFISMISS